MIFDQSVGDRKVRTFSLSNSFLDTFKDKQPNWGPVGYFTYKRCVSIETPVLCDDLIWRPAGELKEGQGIIGFDEEANPRKGNSYKGLRHVRFGVVTHNSVEEADTWGIELEDGAILYATPDHSWLVKSTLGDNRIYWKETKDLGASHKGGSFYLLRPFGCVWETDSSYSGGFLSAAFDGEGCFDRNHSLSFIQVDNPMLKQVRDFLDARNIHYVIEPRKLVEGRKPCFTVRVNARAQFLPLLGSLRPPRLLDVFRQNVLKMGGDMGALRCDPENYVKVLRVFPAGKRQVAVMSTDIKTHFTGGFASHNTYARDLPDGSTEEWWQTCRRVIEGCFNIQKVHCRQQGLPWDEAKAQASAQEMYRRMYEFKWSPPGRGLWMMGTDVVYERGAASLQNCAFHSTDLIGEDFSGPFTFLMDLSMLGVGVGMDTKGRGKVKIQTPRTTDVPFVVEDSREGWVDLLRVVLDSFVGKSSFPTVIDYTKVRGRGALLKTFGGVASGPRPLQNLIEGISRLLLPKGVSVQFEVTEDTSAGTIETTKSTFEGSGEVYRISSAQIVDVANYIGKCVVAGGIRRTAEIMFGEPDDQEFVTLKQDAEALQDRRWASNNSIFGYVGMDYTNVAESIAVNGEPGICWLENTRAYSRMGHPIDNKDWRVMGTNPCFAEGTLIAVADGRGAVDIKQLAEEGKDVPVYSLNKKGQVEIKWGRHPRMTQESAPLVQVILDDGTSFKVTPDHKMILLNGSQCEAKDLQCGDSLPRFTKELVQVSAHNQNRYVKVRTDVNRHVSEMEHRMIAQFYQPDFWQSLYDASKKVGWVKGGLVVHHKDFNPLNNSPDNLMVMTFHDHQNMHAKLADTSGEKNGMWGKRHSEETKRKIGERSRQRCQDPVFLQKLSDAQKVTTREAASERMSAEQKARLFEYYKEQEASTDLDTVWLNDCLYAVRHCEVCGEEMVLPWRSREKAYCSISCHNKVESFTQKRLAGQAVVFADTQRQRLHQQISVYKDLADMLGRAPLKSEWETKCREKGVPVRFRTKGTTSNPFALSGYRHLQDVAAAYNHRVKEVRVLDTQEPVYNITVDDNHTLGIILGVEGCTTHGIFTANCGEQPLESAEMCNLVETYPAHHDTYEDFERTLKMAYLYAKTVTLVPTHIPKTNAVMTRNRRIGCSMSGIVQAVQKHGRREFLRWCDNGYDYIQRLDRVYSEWLGIPLSVKTTTVKPSGCQVADTLINTDAGIFRLDELGDVSGEIWQEISRQTSLGESVTKFFVNGTVPTKVIQTEDGNVLESSLNHRYRVVTDGVICWKEAGEISVGDMLLVSLGDYTKDTEAPLVAVDSPYCNTRNIKQPLEMNPKLAWFLGLVYGDGSVHKKGLRISFNRKEASLVHFITLTVKELFDIDVLVDNDHSIYINSTHLLKYLETNQMLKDYSCDMTIPVAIRTSSKESIKAFITGLWRADGAIFNRSTWGICTVSEKFARELLILCRAIGFNVKMKNAGPGGWGSLDRWLITSRMQDADCLRYVSGALKDRQFSENLWLDPVVEVTDSENPTYDIEVPTTKEYVANGVVSHNTVSLLCGATPGIHYPHSQYYIRHIRVQNTSPLVQAAIDAGYQVEPDTYADNTSVVAFPVEEKHFLKGKDEVTIWEQFLNAADMQKHWADNQVSCTITFKRSEKQDIKGCLEAFEDRLKGISMLPLADSDHGYKHAPYVAIDKEQYLSMVARIKHPISLTSSAHDKDSEEKFCSGDTCMLKLGK